MRVTLALMLCFCLPCSQIVTAQKTVGDTTLKGSTIEVIQSYKPQVKKAPKPAWMPQLPPADTSRPDLNYEVPQQTLYYSYTSEQIRPLALGRDSITIPFPNYVKAGVGNLSTLFLDAGIGNFRGSNYETAIHLHHLSQKSSLKSQQTAFSGAEAEGVMRQGENVWHATAAVARNQYFYYGYNHDLYTPNSDSLKQIYTTVGASGDLLRKFTLNDKEILAHPVLGLSIYDARFGFAQTNINLKAPFSYHIDSSLEAVVTLETDFARLKTPYGSYSNNIGELMPGVILHSGNVLGHAFIGFALGSNKNAYVLPDLVAEYPISGTTLTLSGGWKAAVYRNTYEELTTENPYFGSAYLVQQQRNDEIFAHLSGSYNSHINYLARVSWWNFTNLPVYLRDSSSVIPKFYALYDNVSALGLQASVHYIESGKWSAGINIDYKNYYEGSVSKVWHVPALRVNADLSVVPLPQLTVMAYVGVLAGINAIDGAGKSVVLKPVTDIGANAEYQLVNHLSCFLQLDNLLNNKYERWLGYQSYGLNIYGGVRLKF